MNYATKIQVAGASLAVSVFLGSAVAYYTGRPILAECLLTYGLIVCISFMFTWGLLRKVVCKMTKTFSEANSVGELNYAQAKLTSLDATLHASIQSQKYLAAVCSAMSVAAFICEHAPAGYTAAISATLLIPSIIINRKFIKIVAVAR